MTRRRNTENPADAYARQVIDGDVPAGRYHRLACERHRRDRAREGSRAFPYRFDWARAEAFVRFAGELRHYKGTWAGERIRLEPSQVFRLGSIVAWVDAAGLRRFRQSYHELPRKNGKSLEAAVIALYLTFFDGEAGAEGYCAATKRDQAAIVFANIRALVRANPHLARRIEIKVGNLSIAPTASKFEPLSADYNSMDGLNVHFACLDELHAYKDRGTIDVIETATGAREQPHIFKITTAGNAPLSPCGAEHKYATEILEGVVADERYFAFIAHADPEDDWTSPETWRKANPNYGISVNPEDLEAKATKARHLPSASEEFKQKHLNLWVNAVAPCLSVDGWKRGQSDWTEAELEHEPCFIGVDLASRIDLCVLSFVFPPTPGRGRWRLIQRIWTPAETLADRAHRDRVPYKTWADQGWLIAVPGASVDHDVVRRAIVEARDRFDIQQIGFDPWHADAPIRNLVTVDGFPKEHVLEVPQTYAGMSAACLRFQAETLEGAVDARRCPVTGWAVGNVVGQSDEKGNLMFAKRKSSDNGRIDPVIAATIAMSLAIRREDATASVYLERGIRVLGE